MADGFAQSTGKPALVNVHTAAGMGNAMGNLVAAAKGNIPLIVTAGQQTREMVLCEPYLTNKDEAVFPQPWVKWAYEPKRAEDVPAAIMRAYAVALQPPPAIQAASSPGSGRTPAEEKKLRRENRYSGAAVLVFE